MILLSLAPRITLQRLSRKFEDEYGQTHLCLLGNNLKMWKENGWIEITAE